MTAMLPTPELVALLEDPGFTAGKKTFVAVIGALADESLEKKAFRALERAGDGALPAVVRALSAEETPAAVRPALVRLVGRLARGGSKPALDVLEGALTEEEPRTFREVLVQLGKGAPTETLAPKLLAAAERWLAVEGPAAGLRTADREALRREVLWALATVGGAEGRAFAGENGLAGKGAVVARREEARAHDEAPLAERAVAPACTWRLRCRAGFEEILREELEERLGALGPVRVERGVVTFAGAFPLAALGAVRTASEIEAVLPLAVAPRESAPAKLAAAVAETVAPWLRPLFAVSEASTALPRMRIAFARRDGRGRAEIFALAEALGKHGIVSDGRNAPVSLVFERSAAEGVAVAITLHALGESRFSYRVADVPAASHPTVAAALVRASRPQPDDVVWDPFCGSALELRERVEAGPYVSLHGTDRERRAIDAALANTVGVARISLVVEDACTARPPKVTAIVTNPPLGRRVQDAEGITKLLVRFLAHAATVLAPGGRLVWLSPAPRATREAAAAAGLRLRTARAVDLGGIAVELQIFDAVV
jgi:hypothetical protein